MWWSVPVTGGAPGDGRGERDLDVAAEGRVGGLVADAAEGASSPSVNWISICSGLVTVPSTSMGEASFTGVLAGAEEIPAKGDVRRLPLRKTGAEHLQAIADLRVVRRQVQELNELGHRLALAAGRPAMRSPTDTIAAASPSRTRDRKRGTKRRP